MQLDGHAAAHRKQATHFSRPFSSRWSTCRPRNRCSNFGGSSGYPSATVGESISAKVTRIPLAIAEADWMISSILDGILFQFTKSGNLRAKSKLWHRPECRDQAVRPTDSAEPLFGQPCLL